MFQHSSNDRSYPLLFLMKKQTLLGSIAVISTIITQIGYLLIDAIIFWINIDMIISTFCVILMFSWNNECVNILCGKCLNNWVKQTHKELLKIKTGNHSDSNIIIKVRQSPEVNNDNTCNDNSNKIFPDV